MTSTEKPVFRTVRIVWNVFYVVEVLLLLRLALKLVGANPAAAFTDFVYGITSPLVIPFRSVVSVSAVGPGVIEWFVLLALFVYWIVASLLVRLLVMLRPVSRSQARSALEQEEHDAEI